MNIQYFRITRIMQFPLNDSVIQIYLLYDENNNSIPPNYNDDNICVYYLFRGLY